MILGTFLPYDKKTAVFTTDNPRALDSKTLAETARKYCNEVVDAENPKSALSWAFEEAKKEDVVLVFGSLSFMEEMRECYEEISKDINT